MPMSPIYRYIFILILSGCAVCGSLPAFAQADTATSGDEEKDEPARKKFAAGHQLLIGVDIMHPVLNKYVTNKYTYEAEAQYYLKNEYYAVAEAGWGGADVDYTDLKYTTTNNFARIGFNKSILYRESAEDWDMMFIGLRAAMANVNRSASAYVVYDSVWGNVSGFSQAKSFNAVWAEVTTGIRVGLFKGLMAGWNIRGKFLMNGKSFKDLAPLHIAGYGKGDKNANFDISMYVSYAIRWKRNSEVTPPNRNDVKVSPAEP